jgi:hypothetical protein
VVHLSWYYGAGRLKAHLMVRLLRLNHGRDPPRPPVEPNQMQLKVLQSPEKLYLHGGALFSFPCWRIPSFSQCLPPTMALEAQPVPNKALSEAISGCELITSTIHRHSDALNVPEGPIGRSISPILASTPMMGGNIRNSLTILKINGRRKSLLLSRDCSLDRAWSLGASAPPFLVRLVQMESTRC